MGTRRIVALDSLKFIFAIFIVLHHIFNIIYEKNLVLFSKYSFETSYLAVEGFFILSGFFLGASFYRRREELKQAEEKANVFNGLILSKLKRIYPEFLFALLLISLLKLCLGIHIPLTAFLFNFILIADLQSLSHTIVGGSWYVMTMFWGTFFFAAILVFKDKVALNVILPLLFFLLVCSFLSVAGSVPIGETPYWISGNMLRGLTGLVIGILLFAVCQFLAQNDLIASEKKKAVILWCFELAAIIFSVKYLLKRYPSIRDFSVYFTFSYLIALLYFGREKLLKFLSSTKFEKLSELSYSLFLTHIFILELAKKYVFENQPGGVSVSYVPLLVIVCVIFAFVCFHAQRVLFAGLKKWLAV